MKKNGGGKGVVEWSQVEVEKIREAWVGGARILGRGNVGECRGRVAINVVKIRAVET